MAQKYVLIVDGEPRDGFDALDDAKSAASRFFAQKSKLLIRQFGEAGDLPSVMLEHEYDYQLKSWVVVRLSN